MSYLYREGSRAINPKFESAYKAYEAAKRSKAAPIEKEDVEDLKEALAAFGIDNGKRLGLALFHVGLLKGKDKGERQGQNLYKDLTKLSYKQLEALVYFCDRAAEEQADYTWQMENDADTMLLYGYEGAEDLEKEAQSARAELEKQEKALSFIYRLPLAAVDQEAKEELAERALVEGLRALDNEHRRALLLNLQGLLMAQYRAPAQNKQQQERSLRAREICAAIDTATTPNKPRKVEALADLIMNRDLGRYREERDNSGKVLLYYDPETDDVVEDLQEAALWEYTNPREI